MAAPLEPAAVGPRRRGSYGAEDVPYLRGFHLYTAPAWLDHVALVNGIEPPQRATGFTWCDFGCGHGVTAALLAAVHPSGIFHAVDVMPDHVDFARRLADEAAIANATFHLGDFADARFDLPRFDYIVAHGVYSWIDAAARSRVTALIAQHLKPGGLVYVSYDAMPGRANVVPTQTLLKALSHTFPGDSIARMEAAATVVRRMADLRVPALADNPLVADLDPQGGEYSPSYLVHAYMTTTWQSFFATEIRALMAEVGLVPVGSATLIQNYDDYVLGRRAREILGQIPDDDVRELARDYFMDRGFRRDVFARPSRRLSEDERRERLLGSTYALTRPAAHLAYSMATPAGTLRFDNETSRSLVQGLADGPARFTGFAERLPHDVLANLLVLCAAEIVRPVEPDKADVANINSAILRRFGGAEEISVLALPSGTALPINSDLLQLLEGGGAGTTTAEIALGLSDRLAARDSRRSSERPHYITVLDQLHAVLRPKNYLEIGTRNGNSLRVAKCVSLAIDPAFDLQRDVIGKKPCCLLYQMRSDVFFASHDPKSLLGGPIDLAFIDSMHLVEFALRDFASVEWHAQPTSVIVLRDVLPGNLWMAERQPRDGEPGTGDVWKLVVLLRKYRPELKLQAVNAAPTGLLLCTNLSPTQTILSEGYAELREEAASLDLATYGLARYQSEFECCNSKVIDIPSTAS